MNLKYFFGSIISLPLLPIIAFQGKKIKKEALRLPEAKDAKGFINLNTNKTLKLIAIGESTIAGVGVDFHKNGFTGALAKEISNQKNISILWRVYAKSGYTARLVRLRLLPKIEESNADAIVIGLGGNDAFKLNSPSLWMFQINSLIKQLKKKFPKTPIYFTNMPPIKEFPAFTKSIKFVVGNLVEIFGDRLNRRVKKKSGVYYNNDIITLETWKAKFNLKGDLNTFFNDGIHPSKTSYQIWGKDMANFIIHTRSFNKWMQKK
ncbi:SGNH/GDSL hydrolase family protein [uncultured Polaribacter sp.]|uniref:SGNH/GDSL hydrolase family protein n=1 Tax=uncultured Polaribacter sp. TaxID=174711 RepID=UPI00260972B0|nr:SGNH/GDSL hydrolase family protein [uncultured Polaribacter sp.]